MKYAAISLLAILTLSHIISADEQPDVRPRILMINPNALVLDSNPELDRPYMPSAEEMKKFKKIARLKYIRTPDGGFGLRISTRDEVPTPSVDIFNRNTIFADLQDADGIELIDSHGRYMVVVQKGDGHSWEEVLKDILPKIDEALLRKPLNILELVSL